MVLFTTPKPLNVGQESKPRLGWLRLGHEAVLENAGKGSLGICPIADIYSCIGHEILMNLTFFLPRGISTGKLLFSLRS
jgi:hypothetical protein